MSNRIQKVNELIRVEVSQILLTELGDHKGLITITAVDTTADLRHALIWFRYLGGEEAEIEKILKEKQWEIQKTLNSRLSMKFVPKLIFKYDKSGDYVDKISKLLKEADDSDRTT